RALLALFPSTTLFRSPPPEDRSDAPLKALIVDSWFDNYLGVNSLVRIEEGRLTKGDRIRLMSSGNEHPADEIGIFTPKRSPQASLECGQVGFIAAGIKEVNGAPVGDTIT